MIHSSLFYSQLIEDVSLCFTALNGLPGPYIKWFVEDLKLEGLSKILTGYDDKRAVAQVIYAYGERDKDGKPTEPSKLFTTRSLTLRQYTRYLIQSCSLVRRKEQSSCRSRPTIPKMTGEHSPLSSKTE